jgi:hypothetical protein
MTRFPMMVTLGLCLCAMTDTGCGGPPPPHSESSPPWGAAAHGLTASLAADKLTFATDQPVEVRFRIKNVADKEQTVWNCGFWPNHRLEMTDAQGAEVPMTEKGKQTKAAFAPTGPRRKTIPVTLAPAAMDEQTPKLDLRQYFQIAPGTYRVRCLYHEGPVKVWSNLLTIECR